jgi:peptidoglycan/LPS O-acetylase OafA/YrhL
MWIRMTQSALLIEPLSSAESRASAAADERFSVLDSWRGICALLVALLHFPTSSALSQSAFVGSSYLFVDFFFVLSGFVIAGNYGRRLAEPRQVARFVLVRFGRLYPLHLFVLGLFVAFEIVRLLLPQLQGAGAPPPFTGENSFGNLAINLLLLQGTGVASQLTWNGPSWSISSEFFAYLIFAGVVFAAGRRGWLVLCAMLAAGPFVLAAYSPTNMDATYHLGLVRCLYGFSAGALLAWFLHDMLVEEKAAAASGPHRLGWTVAELCILVAIGRFVMDFGDNAGGIAAPFLFTVALYIFAHEGGLVSALLRGRFFLLLGTLSYSIYMLHIFVQGRMINVAGLVDKKFGTDLVGPMVVHGIDVVGIAPGKPWLGIAAVLLMLAATIVASWLTWRFVEMPAMAWFRRLAKRI